MKVIVCDDAGTELIAFEGVSRAGTLTPAQAMAEPVVITDALAQAMDRWSATPLRGSPYDPSPPLPPGRFGT